MATLVYNPDKKPKAQLIAEFVIRKRPFNSIFADLESGNMQYPEQHYLLVGQRGAGKTTLLTRIKYSIEDSPILNPWLIPVLLTEEQYNVTELANLWENIARYLEDQGYFTGLCDAMERKITVKDFEGACYNILSTYLDKMKKKIVLLVDNLGDLLKKFNLLEVRRLREILQTQPHLRLIASSTFLLEGTTDYHQPLLEFFKVIRLEALTLTETQDLLLTLGDVLGERAKIETIMQENPERIAVLRTLTGGVPRTIALLFQVFIDNVHGQSLQDLEKLLDAVTPLYKHRMDDLKPQQQKIMDAVAQHWDAISVGELRKKVRLESKTISAQLHVLVQNQVLEKVPTKTKNHLYLLKERFFNIWYLMRYGRKEGQQRVIWLVRFLESWCSPQDLAERVKDYSQKIQSGLLNKHYHDFYGQVYASLNHLEAELKYLLQQTTPNNIAQQIELNEPEVLKIVKKLVAQEKYEAALSLLGKQEYLSAKGREVLVNLLGKFKLHGSDHYIKLMQNTFLQPSKNVLEETPHSFTTELSGYLLLDFTSTLLVAAIKREDFFEIRMDIFNSLINILNANIFCNKDKALHTLLSAFILSLLTKKAYQLTAAIFEKVTNFNLQEFIKPAYFATIYFTKGEDSVEYLKMGTELKETVTAMVEKIKENQGN